MKTPVLGWASTAESLSLNRRWLQMAESSFPARGWGSQVCGSLPCSRGTGHSGPNPVLPGSAGQCRVHWAPTLWRCWEGWWDVYGFSRGGLSIWLSERGQLITRSVFIKLQSRPRLAGPHVFSFSLISCNVLPFPTLGTQGPIASPGLELSPWGAWFCSSVAVRPGASYLTLLFLSKREIR